MSPLLSPTVLEGPSLRMEPLRAEHAEAYLAAHHPSCYQFWTDEPTSHDLEGIQEFLGRVLEQEDRLAMIALDKGSGEVVAFSSFYDASAKHRRCEVGYTWVRPDCRGGRVNPEIKLLMLGRAFEDWDLLRVQIKCDARNRQSQAAISKLGAVREGVLRQHMLMPDGVQRDTVMFSVIAPEWPAVRQGLLDRLDML